MTILGFPAFLDHFGVPGHRKLAKIVPALSTSKNDDFGLSGFPGPFWRPWTQKIGKNRPRPGERGFLFKF